VVVGGCGGDGGAAGARGGMGDGDFGIVEVGKGWIAERVEGEVG